MLSASGSNTFLSGLASQYRACILGPARSEHTFCFKNWRLLPEAITAGPYAKIGLGVKAMELYDLSLP